MPKAQKKVKLTEEELAAIQAGIESEKDGRSFTWQEVKDMAQEGRSAIRELLKKKSA